MGKRNSEWHREVYLDVAVSAPDEAEAEARFEDVVEALNSRFQGSEIFRSASSRDSSRIAGRPMFRGFSLAGGEPRLAPPNGEQPRPADLGSGLSDTELLMGAVHTLARLYEKGLLPEDDEVSSLARRLRDQLPPEFDFDTPQT